MNMADVHITGKQIAPGIYRTCVVHRPTGLKGWLDRPERPGDLQALIGALAESVDEWNRCAAVERCREPA